MTHKSDVLLWGHSLAEYRSMFNLTEQDLDKSIIDCASGFASFNAEMHQQGKKVLSCDQAYQMTLPDLKQFVTAGFHNVINRIKTHANDYEWKFYGSLHAYEAQGKKTMATFIADYPVGQQEGRYLAGSLPTLPFTERDFELALCAYLLFANSRLSLAFHLAAIKEMCRVAEEVRIYPLIDEKGEPAATLAPVMLALQQENYGVAVKEVAYELQRGGNAMLCIWAQECIVPQK